MCQYCQLCSLKLFPHNFTTVTIAYSTAVGTVEQEGRSPLLPRQVQEESILIRNAHPPPGFSDLPTALLRLCRVVDSSSFYSSQRKASAFFLESYYMHRVDIAESFSDPTWIFNFGPYGHLRAVKEKSPIILKYATFDSYFFMFSWANVLFFSFF